MDFLKRWRRCGVALFVTFHIACVAIFALPRPPAVDGPLLDDPEVKTELETSIRALHSRIPWRDTPEEQLQDLLAFARGYRTVIDRARGFVTPYLRFVDSTQSWHMFGGTPPRFPLILVVEVKPRNERDYILYQDLRWGTRDSAEMNFRHRKVHENLAFWSPSKSWNEYARYWARRWDEENPDRPAAAVRLSLTQLTTPSPQQVRNGDSDRHPESGRQAHEWVSR